MLELKWKVPIVRGYLIENPNWSHLKKKNGTKIVPLQLELEFGPIFEIEKTKLYKSPQKC